MILKYLKPEKPYKLDQSVNPMFLEIELKFEK